MKHTEPNMIYVIVAAGRIAAGLLFGGQALVQERTLSTALGRSITIQAVLVRASHVLHDVVVGTHQLPVRIPDKGHSSNTTAVIIQCGSVSVRRPSG